MKPNREQLESAFFCDTIENVEWVYGHGRRQQVETLTHCHPTVITSQNFQSQSALLTGVEVIFSTWGMPFLGAAQLARLPNLRAVFFAAGSVQGFARPLLERGIAVISAWAANAVPVAEFTLAQIILANKGYFRNVREYRQGRDERSAFTGRGTFGETVALLGAGQIGRHVIRLLKPFHTRVLVFDPFLPAEDAEALGVATVSLDEAFAQGYVVSNHLANLPATVGLLKKAHFASMRADATFINTGRATTVVEPDLVGVLQARSDLTALLDLADDPRLFDLPNVRISSHIAGSKGDEVVRMADYMIEEFKAWQKDKPLRFAVSLPMLENMA